MPRRVDPAQDGGRSPVCMNSWQMPCATSPQTPPMCTIMRAGTPEATHAAMPRFSGFMPWRAITFSLMRTFTPSTMSAFSAPERELPRARCWNDEATERGKVVRARIARRHHRSRALVRDQFVGRDADGRPVGVRVAMQVDEAGGHQLAARVHYTLRAVGRDRWRDGRQSIDAWWMLRLERAIPRDAALRKQGGQLQPVDQPHVAACGECLRIV